MRRGIEVRPWLPLKPPRAETPRPTEEARRRGLARKLDPYLDE